MGSIKAVHSLLQIQLTPQSLIAGLKKEDEIP